MKKETLSKVTSKFQTTIPNNIRKKLRIAKGEMLHWEIKGNNVFVEPIHNSIFSLQGSISVGKGDIAKDVEKAREWIAKQAA